MSSNAVLGRCETLRMDLKRFDNLEKNKQLYLKKLP